MSLESYGLSRNKRELEKLAHSLVDELGEAFGLDAVRDYFERNPVRLPEWPGVYVNRDTGKEYTPHHEEEARALADGEHRYLAALGGEGGGKSVFGIVRSLERIKTGCSGIMVSPDLPHLKKSLWPEFRRWCPWEMVHEKHRNMAEETWSPYQPFHIVFTTGAVLYVGGMDEPGAWEGPNVNFAHFDEARRKKEADVLKVLDGRVRIPGPNGELPQMWFTTTPRMHWLYEYFGPLQAGCMDCAWEGGIEVQAGEKPVCPECGSSNLDIIDELQNFKEKSLVFRLFTKDNEENLQDGFSNLRALSLTESEARVLLEAAWEDVEEGQPFLPSITWWDQCRGNVPPLDEKAPLVVGVDAASGRQVEDSDCFAIVAVSPDPADKHNSVIVRYVNIWQAKRGNKIDFRGSPKNPGPERELLRMCGFEITDDGGLERTHSGHNVKCVACDPTGLDDMIQRFRRQRVAYMKEIGQNVVRVKADTNLLRMIAERRITHDGNRVLREHLNNADRKVDEFGHKLRIVKRTKKRRIDAAIALSQAAYTCTRLQL